tara:strand:+ start:8590 stop:9594 length:1005 start_codon:yes stop_codon:yes gene_type:complete
MSLKIIAEIAQGYEGNFTQSKLFIKAAAFSGADLVKFQLVYADELASPDYKYYKLFKNLEMSNENWSKLKTYSEEMNIKLCFDVFGVKSLKLAESINLNTVKLHPTDLTNINFLKAIKKSKISNIILGVGGGYFSEIKKAVSILQNKKLILILGFQGYPTITKDNQVGRLSYLKEKISTLHSNFSIGFADHPENNKFSNSLSILAVGAGATVIEKHLTLGKVMKLEDYESALNPDEFKDSVEILKSSYRALIGIKKTDNFGMSKSEDEYRKSIKRHVVSSQKLLKGSIIKPKDLTLKRTGASSFIENLDQVYNKIVLREIYPNQAINKGQIKNQ